jgi:nitroreductase
MTLSRDNIQREDLLKVVNAGILAPSGDNCQPWQIYYNKNRLCIKLIEQKDRSLYNFNNSASLIAIGAMIENMSIVAGSLGFNMSVSLFPEEEKPSVISELSFITAEKKHDHLLEFIGIRSVNRRKYKPLYLSPEEKGELMKVAEEGNAELSLLENDGKKEVSRILSMNDRVLFENRNLHDFLFEHLRWTREEVEASRDGMSIESLELGGFQSKMFRLFSSWNFVRFMNMFGFSRLVPQESYKLCMSSSALCMLLMDGREPEGFINGGRVFQRLWLTAESLGIALHPMTGLSLLIQRMHIADDKGLSNSHLTLLKSLEEGLRKYFPIDDDKSIIMTFRIGHADPPSDKSLRLPVDQVFVEGIP